MATEQKGRGTQDMEFCEREKEPVLVPVRRYKQKAELSKESPKPREGREACTEQPEMSKRQVIPRRWCV